MLISDKGIALIKEFEGLRLKAYLDAANPPVPTIGYGHTKTVTSAHVRKGRKITEEEAEKLLRLDVVDAEKAVTKLVNVPLTQSQYDALVSWTFNLGAGNLQKSTLLKILNKGQYDKVPAEMKRWNKAGGKVLNGLIRRRQAEVDLWNSQSEAAPAPAPVPTPAPKKSFLDILKELFRK